MTVALGVNPVPIKVTVTASPSTPEAGDALVNLGPGEVTAKLNAGVVAEELLSVTVLFPTAAVEAIVKVAVIEVEDATCTLLTAIPEPEKLRLVPAAKLAPVAVTFTVEPAAPLVGSNRVKVRL